MYGFSEWNNPNHTENYGFTRFAWSGFGCGFLPFPPGCGYAGHKAASGEINVTLYGRNICIRYCSPKGHTKS